MQTFVSHMESHTPTRHSLCARMLTTFALIVVMAGLAQTAPAVTEITDCTTFPYSIRSPGRYRLAVDCQVVANAIVIEANSVSLDLNNHTLSGPRTTPSECGDQVSTGITVGASDVHVHGGIVKGFDVAISLGQVHANLLNRLIVTGNCTGIRLYGDEATGGSHGNHINDNYISENFANGVLLQHGSHGNKFKGNVVNANGVPLINGSGGFGVNDSDGNVIVFNVISGNRDYGVTLRTDTTVTGSNHNTIHSNLVKDTENEGIVVQQPGRNNAILGNRVVDNAVGIAIAAGASGNFIQRNRAVDNIVDLVDNNAGCDGNTWKNNTFKTDMVSGQLDDGPGAGCIQ